MKKVRYAVVGTGFISRVAFLPGVARCENAEVTTFITGDKARAAALAAEFGVSHLFTYDQYDAALASGLFDAVYIALPNDQHADFAIRAAARGIHALVEKPLAVTVAEGEAMIAAFQASGTLLMTAYRLHCTPGTVEAYRLIRSGAIGKPRLFTSVFTLDAAAGNHRLKAQHWGGPLQDIGVYCLNAARHVFAAEPVEVLAASSAVSSRGDDPRFAEVPEQLAVTLRFPEDALATFSVGFGAADSDDFRVIGTEGELTLQPAFRFDSAPRLHLVQRAVHSQQQFADIDHFAAQAAYFADCIRTGQQPGPDGAEGLADVAIMRAIEAAAATGRPQQLALDHRVQNPDSSLVRTILRG